MSQPLNSHAPSATEESVAALKRAVKKLEDAVKEREETQNVQLALNLAGAFKGNGTLKKEWKDQVKRQKESEKNSRNAVVTRLKNVNLSVDADTQKKATVALASAAPLKFDAKKMLGVFVALAFAVTVGILINKFLIPEQPPFVLVGLAVAALGQICESVGKTMEAQANPRLKDGLELSGEAVKIFGVLAALAGFAI